MHWAYGAVEEKDSEGDKTVVIAEIYFDKKKPIGYATISNYNFMDNINQITEDLNHQVQARIMFRVKADGKGILMIKRKVSVNGRNKN